METRKIFCVLAVLFLMVAIASTAFGESRKGAFTPTDPHSCWVPYNIKSVDGKWATGVNITCDWFDDTVTARFFAPGGTAYYASVTVPLDASGMWTGMVQNLLAIPTEFVSGSLIIFNSSYGFFSVTQFVVCTLPAQPGFGHQTFYAEPDVSAVM